MPSQPKTSNSSKEISFSIIREMMLAAMSEEAPEETKVDVNWPLVLEPNNSDLPFYYYRSTSGFSTSVNFKCDAQLEDLDQFNFNF